MLLRIYQALILSKLDYGSQAYNSARTSELKKLDVIQTTMLRKVTGATKNTSNHSVQVFTGQMPLPLRREESTLKYWAKTQSMPGLPSATLDTDHGIPNSVTRKRKAGRVSYGLTARELSTKAQLRNCKFTSTIPTIDNYWAYPMLTVNTELANKISKSDNPVFSKAIACHEIDNKWDEGLHVYTDGSKDPTTGTTAAGFYIPSTNYSCSERLTDNLTVYSTELIAIQMALTKVHEIHSIELLKYHKLYVFSDSLSSLQSLKLEKSKSRQDLVHQILKIHDKLYTQGITTELIWVPSHVGIHGNEMADFSAKIGLYCPKGSNNTLSVAQNAMH
jgi:ribonuclease HI